MYEVGNRAVERRGERSKTFKLGIGEEAIIGTFRHLKRQKIDEMRGLGQNRSKRKRKHRCSF